MSHEVHMQAYKVEFKKEEPKTWQLKLANPHDGLAFICWTDKTVPNRFHRLMQRLLLGFRWTRVA